MALTYNELRALIGHKAGFAPNLAVSDFSGDAAQTAIVETILERGLARFGNPPILPGFSEQHRWSFSTPVETLEIDAGDSAIDLPAYFLEFRGPLVYEPGSSTMFPPIELMGAEEVLKRQGADDGTGRPNVGGVRVKTAGANSWELVFHPTADADYELRALMRVNVTVPGADGAQVIGGVNHENTIVAACRLEAALMLDDLDNAADLERTFQECLRASILSDLQTAAAQKLPRMIDPGLCLQDWQRFAIQAWNEPLTLPYNGVVY